MLLKIQWVNEGTKEKVRKYLKINESGNTTLQNLWIQQKAVLRSKYIAM